MQNAWLARIFFSAVAIVALGGMLSGTACTRWGKPGPVPPTIVPLASIYVDPNTGNDTSGNGSQTKPYRTLTKAVFVLAHAKMVSPSGVTIFLASGDYVAANGEKFPIVIPASVSISGSNYGAGPTTGSFIDGHGEDTVFESLAHAAPHSAYTTLEVVPPATVTVSDVYVGARRLQLPGNAQYAAFDVIGTATGTVATFGAGVVGLTRNASGVVVASGNFTCTSCALRGNSFGVAGLTIPLPTASPAQSPPTIVLTHGTGDSTVAANGVDIITDGSANVTVSNETFERSKVAFEDSLRRLVAVTTTGAIDFGGGAGSSIGGNSFIGATVTEIAVTRRSTLVSALDDIWNPNQQGANRNGQYVREVIFGPGTSGRNVVVLRTASGSQVLVGPAPVPTPTPTGSPSASPSPTPS
ncbi:MAG: DUF1565 domain-containing protein [Candidatus Eremiobacteraeota bacterium]|nr:DUF1565 domain-containing protein [Candidatus Eremiobacteraeota bacterium]